jgi:hypothetical protein
LPDGGYQAAWLSGSGNGGATVNSVAISGNGGAVASLADGGSMVGRPEYRVKLQYDAVTPALVGSWGTWETGAMLGIAPPAGSGPAQLTQVSAPAFDPAIVAHSGSLYVAYNHDDNRYDDANDIVIEKRALNGTPVAGPVVLSRGVTQQLTPAVATSGDQVLVVFSEYHADSGYDMMAQRLDAAPVAIDSASGQQNTPAIAGSDAGIYMAVWMDDPSATFNLVAGRFDASGAPLGPTFFPDPMNHMYGTGDVAYGGGVFLVTWSGAQSGDISFRRYAVDGTPLDVMPALLAGPANETPGFAHVGRVGDGFVVAWVSYPAGQPTANILAARVTSDGAILDPIPKTVAQGCNAPQSLSVAGEGNDAVMAWRDYRSGQAEIWGARMRNGANLDDGGVYWVSVPGSLPALHSDSERYVALSEVPGGVLMVYADDGVHAVHLVQGQLGVPESIVSGGHVDGVSVASTAQDSVIVAALSRTPGPPGVSYRIEVSHITRGAPGAMCAYSFNCGTGFCTAGVCTDADGGLPADAGVSSDGGTGTPDGGNPDQDGGTLEQDGGSDAKHRLGVTCGCDAGGASLAAAALLALLRRRRRSRRPSGGETRQATV